jgi:hypothetical protein
VVFIFPIYYLIDIGGAKGKEQEGALLPSTLERLRAYRKIKIS